MAPSQPVREGRAACAGFVADVIAGLLKRFDRRIVYSSAEVRVIGDWALDRGSFTFTVAPRSGGETSTETGKYLFLYSRASDGSRKIARAIVNLDDHDEEPAQ
jgi:ketosteroid isomerase-like protein